MAREDGAWSTLVVAVVRFSADVDAEFFCDRAYVVDCQTVTTSHIGDLLQVNGALKDESKISETTIAPTFALLEFVDRGSTSSDPVLREAEANFRDIEFERLTGLSGSPVFNVTQRKLCGVMVRGTLHEGRATIRYIDFADVLEILRAIVSGSPRTNYNKTIMRLAQPVPKSVTQMS